MQSQRRYFSLSLLQVSIPQAVWIACNKKNVCQWMGSYSSFNTASGMDCMQCLRFSLLNIRFSGFNTASGMDCMQLLLPMPKGRGFRFQYRKRYGLHAILSPRTLENSEPKRWFSSTPSLFAPFPKPQGIFCRKKWFKRGAKPAISRKLLSTRKT